MQQISLAIVGCGDIAHIRYLYAVRQLPLQYRIVALYDSKPEICRTTAKELSAIACDTLEELLSLAEVDTVIVTTYHPSHASIAIACMEAGKNVIIEKPFATSYNDAKRVWETARRMNVRCMAMPYELYPSFIAAKRFLADGAIGRVTSCDAIFSHQGPLHAPWFFDKRRAEWGVLADLGIYPLGVLAYLLGPFHKVMGSVGCLMPDRTALDGSDIHGTVEDSAAAVLEWKDGCVGTIRSNWCTAADKSGSVYQATLYGTRGILYLNMLSHELVIYSPYQPIANAEKIDYLGFADSYRIPMAEFDDHTDLLKTYYELHETGGIADDPDLMERQINIINAIECLYESSLTGRCIVLD